MTTEHPGVTFVLVKAVVQVVAGLKYTLHYEGVNEVSNHPRTDTTDIAHSLLFCRPRGSVLVLVVVHAPQQYVGVVWVGGVGEWGVRWPCAKYMRAGAWLFAKATNSRRFSSVFGTLKCIFARQLLAWENRSRLFNTTFFVCFAYVHVFNNVARSKIMSTCRKCVRMECRDILCTCQ